MDDAFKPHAIIITERSVPSPIWVAGIIGVDKLKRIDLDVTQPEVTFLDQAVTELRERLERWNIGSNGSGQLPAFGKPTGLCINFASDRATIFDLKGNVTKHLSRSMTFGTAITATTKGSVVLSLK
ncbi:hypothetical protein [Methylobacterium iners]|uniref:IclR-ED domain-containing protein n=1 Tax=Methylobacterium iners TaxID=418707 RepID=A0ABQ4RYW2_9HYPH|nr:hypothetical protein [Methylobacterium iners]GJD95404.1 hypothetical protein OCOJLMKI_2616 [Methylobacterium iners]